MADINVERKGPSIWPWIVGLLVLALLIWAVAEMVDRDDQFADPATTTVTPAAEAPATDPWATDPATPATPGTTTPGTAPGTLDSPTGAPGTVDGTTGTGTPPRY